MATTSRVSHEHEFEISPFTDNVREFSNMYTPEPLPLSNLGDVYLSRHNIARKIITLSVTIASNSGIGSPPWQVHAAQRPSDADPRTRDYGDFAHRNPGTYKLRNDGGSKCRSATRRLRGSLSQEPPRTTLNPPDDGPVGFCDGLFL